MLYIVCFIVGGMIGFGMCAILTVASIVDDRMEQWEKREKYKFGDE